MSDRARRSAVGRHKQQVGDAFEAWLEIHHARARNLGILAHVDKIDPPAVMRNGRVEFGPRSVADWVGILEGGRYFAAEQKSTKEARLPRSEVSPKQQAHLETVARAGGLALLVVEFRGGFSSRRYAVPWLDVPWVTLRTAESVSEEALSIHGWLIKDDGCYLAPYHPGGVSSTPQIQKRFPRD